MSGAEKQTLRGIENAKRVAVLDRVVRGELSDKVTCDQRSKNKDNCLKPWEMDQSRGAVTGKCE